MTLYEYAVAVGFDVSSPTNVEEIVTNPPTTNPDQQVPLGSVRRQTLDRRVHTHGARVVVWTWTAMLWSDFEALMIFIFGDLDAENADVTIRTRGRNDLFMQYNAIAHLPLPGEGYNRRSGAEGENGVWIENLKLEFEILSGPSEFTSEFSSEFTI